MLEIKEVTKQYANHKALDGVSITIPAGTIYGLLGPNGAGKTTLIRIINTITAPDSGEVLLNGKRITPADVQRIGYLPEERGLYKKMKVGEQVLFLAQLKGMPKAEALKELKIWFRKFEIEGWWNKKIEELSKGMAQKIQFITTVLHKPDLLILDEPFSGFDPVNTELIRDEILKLRQNGTTIVISTHNMESVEQLCENISLVHRSKIVLQGNVANIRRQFSSHTFRVKSQTQIPLIASEIEVISTECINQQWIYTLRKPPFWSKNELLTTLMNQVEICSFEELLPSMHEIFVKCVSESVTPS